MSVFRRGAHSRRRFCVSRDQRNNPNSYKRSAFSGLKTTDFSRGRGAHKRANDAAKVLSKKNYPAFIGLFLRLYFSWLWRFLRRMRLSGMPLHHGR